MNQEIKLTDLSDTVVHQDGACIKLTEGEQQAPKVQAAEDSTAASLPSIKRQAWCSKFAVTAADFSPEIVGAKSLKTVKLMVGISDDTSKLFRSAAAASS